jgi:hypothetical protein
MSRKYYLVSIPGEKPRKRACHDCLQVTLESLKRAFAQEFTTPVDPTNIRDIYCLDPEDGSQVGIGSDQSVTINMQAYIDIGQRPRFYWNN